MLRTGSATKTDTRYYATSQGNDNIMSGAPRFVRLTLTTGLP